MNFGGKPVEPPALDENGKLAGGPANSFGWWVNGYTNPLNGQTYTATFARGEGLSAYGVYGEDTFKFRPNLTLSYGLRWEYATSPHEEYNRISNLWGSGNPPSCSPYTCATPTVGFPWYNPPKHNFAPRVGFNWDPFKRGKTSVRGGAGIFYNELEDSFWYPSIAAQPPFVTSTLRCDSGSFATTSSRYLRNARLAIALAV